MNTNHIFGGATINLSITPIREETPVDPRLASSLGSLLSLIGKAYQQGTDREMHQLVQGFVEEVDSFFDDRRLGKAEEDPYANKPVGSFSDLEKFMDEVKKKKG